MKSFSQKKVLLTAVSFFACHTTITNAQLLEDKNPSNMACAIHTPGSPINGSLPSLERFASEQDMYAYLSPYVVSVQSNILLSASFPKGSWQGTGFVVDKEKGIILTNAHVAQEDGVKSHFDVILHDGKVCRAQLLYADPWQDFAFLQMEDPNVFSFLEQDLAFADGYVKNTDSIFTIGNSDGLSGSAYRGTVSNVWERIGILPFQSFRMTLNAKGGSSGSPIVNANGHVVGIIYAIDNQNTTWSVPVDYVRDALNHIKQGEKPHRFGTGAIYEYNTCHTLKNARLIDQDFENQYGQDFKDARYNMIVVGSVLLGSPAEGLLYPDDIILSVNNTKIGPSLYTLDTIINNAQGQSVSYSILRNGQPLTVEVPTYNLHDRVVKRILKINDNMFFEMNDQNRYLTGSPGKVLLKGITEKNAMWNLTHINGKEIHSLDDMIDSIESIKNNQHALMIGVKLFSTEHCDKYTHSSRQPYSFLVSTELESPITLHTYDDAHHKWTKTIY